MALSDWDLDYRAGSLGENITDEIVKGIVEGTVEVKTDRRWKETGNLYIETECFYRRSNSWQPSGLSVSKASHYAFVLEGLVLTVPTSLLKDVVEQKGREIKCNIQPNPSKGYLIKVSDLVTAVLS